MKAFAVCTALRTLVAARQPVFLFDLAGTIEQVSDPARTYGFACENMGCMVGSRRVAPVRRAEAS